MFIFSIYNVLSLENVLVLYPGTSLVMYVILTDHQTCRRKNLHDWIKHVPDFQTWGQAVGR